MCVCVCVCVCWGGGGGGGRPDTVDGVIHRLDIVTLEFIRPLCSVLPLSM